MSNTSTDDWVEWNREECARYGTLASALSTMLDQRNEDEMEKIALFGVYNNVLGEYSSLEELPAIAVYHRFYAWSENWVYYDHRGVSDPSRPAAVPRHPDAVLE